MDRKSTNELILFLKSNRYMFYNVSLLIGGFLRSNHIMSYRKSFLYDEDLFDNLIKWNVKDFTSAYKDAVWLIE